MVERFLCCNASSWIVNKDLSQQIEEEHIELSGIWNDVLCVVSLVHARWEQRLPTSSFFMLLTYLREFLAVSGFG